MSVLKTNSGREIECSLILKSSIFPTLKIYTNTLEPAEAWSIFYNNIDETDKLIKIEDDIRQVYRHYNRLHSISPSTFATGEPELEIWLEYEELEEEEK